MITNANLLISKNLTILYINTAPDRDFRWNGLKINVKSCEQYDKLWDIRNCCWKYKKLFFFLFAWRAGISAHNCLGHSDNKNNIFLIKRLYSISVRSKGNSIKCISNTESLTMCQQESIQSRRIKIVKKAAAHHFPTYRMSLRIQAAVKRIRAGHPFPTIKEKVKK